MDLSALLGPVLGPYAPLITAGLMLAVSVAHMRGHQLPIISGLLDFLVGGAKPTGPSPTSPSTPVVAPAPVTGAHPLLSVILSFLQGLPAGLIPKVNLSTGDGTHTLTVTASGQSTVPIPGSTPVN